MKEKKEQENDLLIPINLEEKPEEDSEKKLKEELSALRIMLQTVRIATPMALSFTFTASEIATAMMVARISEDDPDSYLAAATLITTTTNVLACISIAPLFAMSIRASKKQGKLINEEAEVVQDPIKIERLRSKIANIFKSGVGVSTLIMPLPFLGMYFSKSILMDWFGQNEHIAELTQQNLRAYSFALPGLMYRIAAEQMMFAFNKTTPAMAIGLGSFAVGTGLAYFLTFGPPKQGLAGIGYGYVAESYLTCLGFCLYLAKNKIFKDINFFNFLKLDKDILQQAKKMLKLGLPITLQMGFELSAALLIGMFSGWLGQDQLAAQNFATQLFIFAVIPSVALGQTVTQEVSRLIGQQEFRNAMRFARYGLLTSLGLVGTIAIPLAIKPEWLINTLSLSVGDKALQISKTLIPLAATQTVIDTAGYGMTQALRAANDSNIPTYSKISCLVFGILLAYALGLHTSLDIYGIEIGLLIGVALGSMILLPQWINGTNQTTMEKSHLGIIEAPKTESIYGRVKQLFFSKADKQTPSLPGYERIEGYDGP
ncbi:MATE efflux family protein [Legionella lansingensis]|uniref:MATE efflux family protein n=1 Tax=Legionella lansingensis TaxID=45067 RepID=A0A0W0VJT0_9GAMM|nr:MATE family efflux transporter [Legionella lansingensis]KTD20057.1 MATE efflux family protein [Legionella lansingensis]SNV50994.1 MATE efflux family protein [Legionella lansingensis]